MICRLRYSIVVNTFLFLSQAAATPYTFRVSACDPVDNHSEPSCPVTVTTPASSNHAPVLAPIGNRSVPAGEKIQFTVQGTDADGDTLQYSASKN